MSDPMPDTKHTLRPLGSIPGQDAYALISFPREDGSEGHMLATAGATVEEVAACLVHNTHPPMEGWEYKVTLVRTVPRVDS